jgi:alginate O-acetyltransferase complex protein AlgI
MYAGILHASVLVLEVLIVFALMRSIDGGGAWSRSRYWLAVGIPLAVLAYFKYAGFIAANFAALAGQEQDTSRSFSLFADAVLPAGVSFFTFHIVSFCIDWRAGRIGKPTLAQFLLYVIFFPQLVAGPILRFSQVREPIARLRDFRLLREDVAAAIGYVCFGLAAKVLIADPLGGEIETLIREGPEAVTRAGALYIVFAYSFEIYFDFYGYATR